MILASYVRHCDDIPMEEQTDAISKYCRVHKLSISQKYSERSKESKAENAFNKMMEDSVFRAFDTVIFYSFGTFGHNPFKSNDLLSNVFLPAGINFISAKDGYESNCHTIKENIKYISDNFKELKKVNMTKAILSNKAYIYQSFNVYGYTLDDNHIVQIDQAVSNIVQEIFSRALKGEKHTDIAKDLNYRGVVSPTTQHLIKQGKTIDKEHKWSVQNVFKILTSPIYAGEQPKRNDYLNCNFIFPPYINMENYKKIQENINSYLRHSVKKPHIFSTLIFDKETGTSIAPTYSRRKNTMIYNSASRSIKYPGNYLTQDFVINEVNRVLLEEKEKTSGVLALLDSKAGKKQLEIQLQKMTSNITSIYEEMLTVINQLMPKCQNENEAELRCRMKALDADFSSEQTKIDHYKTVFSPHNPWLKLYSTYDSQYIYQREVLKKYIDKIFLYRFQSVEVVLKEQEWRNDFMKEWRDD